MRSSTSTAENQHDAVCNRTLQARSTAVKLGSRLKLLRNAAGLTQAHVAERLNVTKNYVYMVESGRREPSRKYLSAFAKLIDVPLSVIYLQPPPRSDAKTKRLFGKLTSLLAEYANAVGVRTTT